jgi:ribosomal protein S17E
MVGALTTGAAITAGIILGAPVAAAAAAVGASAVAGIQAAGYFAEGHKKTVTDTDTDTTPKPSNSKVTELMKSVSSRLAKIYAVVFTKDEARFETEAEATQFIDDVKQAANNISQHYYDTISIGIDQLCESLSKKLFLQLQQDSLHIMERTNERFNKMFQITRIVPAKFSVQLEDVTSLQFSPIARYRPVFGLWPFEFDAKDVETRKKATKHCVSREELKKNCLNIIHRNMMMIKEKIIERVETAMQEQFEDHFKKLQDDLQGYLDVVKRSLDDQSKTQESQKKLMSMLQEQLDLIKTAEKDFKLFENAIREAHYELILYEITSFMYYAL